MSHTVRLPRDPDERRLELDKLGEAGPFVLHRFPVTRLSSDRVQRDREVTSLLSRGMIGEVEAKAMREMASGNVEDDEYIVLRPAGAK